MPQGRCDTPTSTAWRVLASFGLVIYCAGLPAAAFAFARYHRYAQYIQNKKKGEVMRERVALLISSYEERFWFMESISLVHRFVFTGLIHLLWPETRVQLWLGVVLSLLVFVGFLLLRPYRFESCNIVQAATLLQLLLTYISAFLFYDSGGSGGVDDALTYSDSVGFLLVAVNCTCFVVLLISASIYVYTARQVVDKRRLYTTKDIPHEIVLDKPLKVPKFIGSSDDEREQDRLRAADYTHIFISHFWGTSEPGLALLSRGPVAGHCICVHSSYIDSCARRVYGTGTGQDQARIIKQRLVECFPPGFEVFLDVDRKEFAPSLLEQYIRETSLVRLHPRLTPLLPSALATVCHCALFSPRALLRRSSCSQPTATLPRPTACASCARRWCRRSASRSSSSRTTSTAPCRWRISVRSFRRTCR